MTTPCVRHPLGMGLVRGLPHPGLAGVVSDYADFAQRADGPVESGEAATAGIVVIFDLDRGWAVEDEGFGSFAGGIYMRPVRVRHEGSARGIQVNVEAPVLRRLTGVP